MTADVRYRAFISYSHADQAPARWLHRALESYRVPKRLVGRVTAATTIERRIGRIFRDRDELPVASDLSGKINDALKATDFLIVLCSPAAAKSAWVNQEIVNFKRLKGEDRIICVIVAGEPFASRAAGREAEECFAPALRVRIAGDGTLSDEPAEPIAADLRPGKDSRRLVKLKVIAGLIGVGLDELVRRENARRQQRLFWLATASVAATIVMGVLTANAISARHDAERQKNQAEDLIEFMLGDLRQKLEPVGRLDVLDSVGEKALAYFGTLAPGELDADTLGRKARALHMLGEIEDLRGNLAKAQSAFVEAAQTTAVLLSRTPDNSQRIFEHAQSQYWQGYISYRQGHFDDAEVAFKGYEAMAAKLTDMDAHNLKWRTEAGYAAQNLGVLALNRGQAAQAITLLDSARATFAAIVADDPKNVAVKYDFAQTLAWLAEAHEKNGSLAQAAEHRRLESAVYDPMLADDPKNQQLRYTATVALNEQGWLALERGDIANAENDLARATDAVEALVAFDPSNTKWQELKSLVALDRAEAWIFARKFDDGRAALASARVIAEELVERQPTFVRWQVALRAHAITLEGRLALDAGEKAGDKAAALKAIEQLSEKLAVLRAEDSGNTAVSQEQSHAALVCGDLLKALGREAEAKAAWQAAIDAQGDTRPTVLHQVLITQAYTRLGRYEAARPLAAKIAATGFRRPDFEAALEQLSMTAKSPQ